MPGEVKMDLKIAYEIFEMDEKSIVSEHQVDKKYRILVKQHRKDTYQMIRINKAKDYLVKNVVP